MRLFWVFVTVCSSVMVVSAQDLAQEAWQLERSGDSAEAHDRLRQAAESAPGNASVLLAYAEFLDRHRDPEARAIYSQLDGVLARNAASPVERARIARRLVVLDLIQGDRAAAARHFEEFRAAGGAGLTLPQTAPRPAPALIEIPGPMRSFLRMAGLSPDLKPDELLTALARNVVTNGYQAASATESLEQTEYLKLVIRYLAQAREIERLGGTGKTVHIETCESTETGDLLRILGYRMRGGCGSDVVLETVNASRAFLTIDSGFPLAELEAALRTNRPFTLDYRPSQVPVLYTVEYWQSAKDKTTGSFIDYFLSDPSLCRLYLGLSKLDPETAEDLRKAIPAPRLKVYAHVLDFFGGMFQIRDGRAVVPGGARSERAWSDLAGTSPERGAAFFERIIVRDDGWMASYFDALARINGPAKDYLTEPERMKRFYAAMRGRVTSPGPARPVFRANTDVLLLTTRLRMDPGGKPHLPGGLDVWKSLFGQKVQAKNDARLQKAAPSWRDADDVLEAMFGLSRKAVDNEPLKIFMALGDVERNRARPLEAGTVSALARDYTTMSAQYRMFSEAPGISDKVILSYLDTARALNQIRDPLLRSESVGMMQALAGLWQIFLRQRTIPEGDADAALAGLMAPFAKIQNERDAFDAGRGGVQTLLKATHSPSSENAQDRMIDLLAGTGAADSSVAHQQVLEDMIRVFEAQRLVSLSTILDLADNLESVAHGKKLDVALAAKLASRISDIQLPRNSLNLIDKNSEAYGFWAEKHIDVERRVNLRSAIDKGANDAQKLQDLRGTLTPFLRDTLVGYNYIHYAPPGAQVLHTNPLFVRSHDFIGVTEMRQTWKETQVFGSGWPANAGGRLTGSLAGLPYALAEAEQNFLIPSREQALIWGDLVPQMILSAVVPRWWSVTPLQLHWVGLHMAYAETLLAEGALSETSRKQVLSALDHYLPPARLKNVESLMASGDVRGAEENVVPSEMYLLAIEIAAGDRESPIAAEIRKLAAEAPDEVSPGAISHAFGTPKPTLANSYEPELLNLRTFPTLMGYSSRILAESWESNLLYYAALADEMHIRPVELNILVPAWTQKTVENIFASHLEDWPALLRSLRTVGDDVRLKSHKQIVAVN